MDWYFDFISPFAYLQFQRMGELSCAQSAATPRLRPVLFAGLLSHWGQLGPAEIPTKRRFTYRHVLWQAREQGMTLRAPPRHPFNPLMVLRLAVALDATPQVVKSIFDFIWRDGRDPNDEWPALCEALGLDANDAHARLVSDAVKQGLRANTDEAIRKGVFGVPTLVVNDELFWGEDSTRMASAYLRDATAFEDEEMLRVSGLPAGVERQRRS